MLQILSVDYKKILQLIQESPERVGEEKLHLYQFTNTSLNSLFRAKPSRSFQMYNMRFSIVPLLAVITAASSPHGWPLPGFNTWGTHFSGFTCLHPPCQPALSTCFLQLGCHHSNHKSAFILFNQIYQASPTKTTFAIVKANLSQSQLMRLMVLLLRVHLVVI